MDAAASAGTGCYGDEGVRLVREARRARDMGVFVAYADSSVRNVKLELRHLHDSIKAARDHILRLRATLSAFDEAAGAGPGIDSDGARESLVQETAALTVAAHMHHQAVRRNKRLLLVYHRARLDALRDVVWDLGAGAATALSDETSISSLSDVMANETEQNPFGTANPTTAAGLPASVARAMSPAEHDFLANYRRLLEAYRGTVLDVDLAAPLVPPSDLYIEVRVVKDVGEIVAESGAALRLMKGDQLFVRRTDVDRFITLGYLVQL